MANGFEEVEALTPIDMLRRAGLEVVTVGVESPIATGSHGIPVSCDVTPDALDEARVDAVILPGGMPGSVNLAESAFVSHLVTSVYERGGRIAAICAAPLVLGRLGLLEGKRATCYPGFENELIGATVTEESVVTDGLITTARGMGVALEFAKKLVSLLVGEKKTEELSRAIMEPVQSTEKTESAANLSQFGLNESAREASESDSFEPDDEELETTAFYSASCDADYSDFRLPSHELFSKGNETSVDRSAETAEVAEKIKKTLETFNVRASITNVEIGPRVARYSILPEGKTKVSSITKLLDDIALSLAVEGIRMEAPIPGRAAIGLEVPFKKAEAVRFCDVLRSQELEKAGSLTSVCIGVDVCGEAVIQQIEKLPHIIVAGATGMGKSVCINSMLAGILCRAKPNEVKLIMIDLKKVEFGMYEGLPHLLQPVITSPENATGALKWAIDEMERRYDAMEKVGARGIDAYNAKVCENPECGPAMPKILIVIDELTDLMIQAARPIESYILFLAQKSRAAGIHLIIGTQRPTVDVLTGVIKANIPSRIALKTVSYADSRTVIDTEGAEKLLPCGDMLFLRAGALKPIRVQGPFISDAELEALLSYIKSEVGEFTYNAAVCDEFARLGKEAVIQKKATKSNSDAADRSKLDESFVAAVELAIANKKISTSLLQRKLGIGFGKAAKYLDMMEELGFVSGPDGHLPREVYITEERWKEALKKIGY